MSDHLSDFGRPEPREVPDAEVNAAGARVHRRLRGRRRARAGGTVAATLLVVAGLGTAWAMADSGSESELVASGAGQTDPAPQPPETGDGNGDMGPSCGVVPVVAEDVGLEVLAGDERTWPKPNAGQSSPSAPTTITVRNNGTDAVQLTTAPGPSLMIIGDDGAIASGLSTETLAAGYRRLRSGAAIEVGSGTPRQACSQIDSDELLPAGTYQVAPVALVTRDDGEAVLVRGELMDITFT